MTSEKLSKNAGFLYLFIAACAPVGMIVVPSRLVVPGDAAATAERILASPMLFRAGMISDLLVVLGEVILTVVLFLLFRATSRGGAGIAAFSRLGMAVIQAVNLLVLAAVPLLLAGGESWSAFSPAQLRQLAHFALQVHEQGVLLWEALFGLHSLVLAGLIFRSGFLPKALAALMTLTAAGYLAHSFGGILFPLHARTLTAVAGAGSMAGEVPFMLWLLFKGARVPSAAI